MLFFGSRIFFFLKYYIKYGYSDLIKESFKVLLIVISIIFIFLFIIVVKIFFCGFRIFWKRVLKINGLGK